jgi:hypothetical protein
MERDSLLRAARSNIEAWNRRDADAAADGVAPAAAPLAAPAGRRADDGRLVHSHGEALRWVSHLSPACCGRSPTD